MYSKKYFLLIVLPVLFCLSIGNTAWAWSVDIDIGDVVEGNEENPGGYICLNDDDDNNNGTVDKDDTSTVTGEDDLVQLWLSRWSGSDQGSITLTVVDGADKIKIYKDPEKEDELVLDGEHKYTWNDLSLPPEEGGFPSVLYVEGIAISGAARDVELTLTWTDITDPCDDKVKITVVKCDVSGYCFPCSLCAQVLYGDSIGMRMSCPQDDSDAKDISWSNFTGPKKCGTNRHCLSLHWGLGRGSKDQCGKPESVPFARRYVKTEGSGKTGTYTYLNHPFNRDDQIVAREIHYDDTTKIFTLKSPNGYKVVQNADNEVTITLNGIELGKGTFDANGVLDKLDQGADKFDRDVDGDVVTLKQERGAGPTELKATYWRSTKSAGKLVRKRVTVKEYNTDGTERFFTSIYGYDNDERLSYVVEPEGVVRCLAVKGYQHGIAPNDPDNPCGLDTTLTDNDLKPYASIVYDTYDGDGRVTQLTRHGGGGAGVYKYVYGSNYRRTTAPSGLQTVEFLDDDEQVTYEITQEMNDDKEIEKVWITHYKYDSDGRLIEQRSPSACKDYTTTTEDDGSGYEWVKTVTADDNGTTGLVRLYGYHDASGRTLWEKVRQGTSTTQPAYFVRSYTYIKNTHDGHEVWRIETSKVYPTSNPDDALTTTHAYIFYEVTGTAEGGTTSTLVDNDVTFSDDAIGKTLKMTSGNNNGETATISDVTNNGHTLEIEGNFPHAVASGDTYRVGNLDARVVRSKTVTHPMVTTDHNGLGSATSVIYHYTRDATNDLYYNDWTKHEDGTYSYTELGTDDNNFGQVLKSIVDASSNAGDVSDFPGDDNDFEGKGDWPARAGKLHLKTAYDYYNVAADHNYGQLKSITDPSDKKTVYAYMCQYQEGGADPVKETTTRLVTLTTPHMSGNNYNYTPVQITVSDLGGRTLISAVGVPSTANSNTDGDLKNDWDADTDNLEDAFDVTGAAGTATLCARTVTSYTYDTGGGSPTYAIKEMRVKQWTDADDEDSGDEYETVSYYNTTLGFVQKVEALDDTLTWIEYDQRGRAVETWIGTDATDAAQGDPSDGGNNNMKKVSATFYDEETPGSGISGVGDGNVTQTKTLYADGQSLDMVSQYDWRGRLVQSRGPDNVVSKNTFDNMGRAAQSQTYADLDTDFQLDCGELRAKSSTEYDEKGQAWQSVAYEVNSDGTVADRLITNFWYDKRGRQIKTANPNGLFTKTKYDDASRATSAYVCYDEDETAYADADDVIGDTVIEQTKTYYDDASNVWLTRQFQRKDNATGTGELTLGNEPKARITYTAQWYDALHRLMRTVFYGTNEGGDDLDQKSEDFNPEVADPQNYDNCQPSGDPDNPTANAPNPNTSDKFITADYFHKAETGRQYLTIDNRNHKTQLTFNDLGRTTKVIENYVNGSVGNAEYDSDRTTEYTFDSSGRLEKITAKNPKGGSVEDQDTKYVYGATLTESGIARNDLLRAVIYPDSDDPVSLANNGPDTIYDRVEYKYDRMGRRKYLKDQRTVEHEYTFDSAGRPVADKVTSKPASVDGTVMRIGRTYDDIGRISKITSYDAADGGDAINEIKFEFDAWGGVASGWQEHDGIVTTTGGTISPRVRYDYADGASGGIAKYVRLNYVVYPCGSRTTYYNYEGSGVGGALARLSDIADGSGEGRTKYADYTYLGAGTMVKVAHPAVSGGLELTYGTGGTYGGFDRFGRIIDQKWQNTAETAKDHYKYSDPGNSKFGYDRNSSRLYRENMLESTLSELYHANNAAAGSEYDGLDRLKEFRRGTLAGDKRSISADDDRRQLFTLEALGNWKGFKDDAGPGNGGGWDLEQTRTHNPVNEISGISEGGGHPVWIDPDHDMAGNMIEGPKPGNETTQLDFTYDAWNRLVKVETSGNTVAEYRYDGQNRRIAKLVPNASNWDRTDYYYNEAWQVLEERYVSNQSSKDDPAAAVKTQYVWDIRYIDAPVCRDEDKNSDGDCTDAATGVQGSNNGDEHLYYTNDANMNVTALVDGYDGAVVERYMYDAYGKVTVLHGVRDNDGTNTSGSEWGVRAAADDFDNEILYCGYRYDDETKLFHVRNRMYHSTLGRWTQRDPSGYADGMSLYEYVLSNPSIGRDPQGTIVVLFKGWEYPGLSNQVLENILNICVGKRVIPVCLTEARVVCVDDEHWGVIEHSRQMREKRGIGCPEPVYIAGYSIGARAALVLAKKLSEDENKYSEEKGGTFILRGLYLFDYNWGASEWTQEGSFPGTRSGSAHRLFPGVGHDVPAELIPRTRHIVSAGRMTKPEDLREQPILGHTDRMYKRWKKVKGQLFDLATMSKEFGGELGLANTTGAWAKFNGILNVDIHRAHRTIDHIQMGWNKPIDVSSWVAKEIVDDYKKFTAKYPK